MKIEDIRVGSVRVPLKTPFKTALRTVDAVEDTLVCVTAFGGLAGWGEAPPTAAITGETNASIKAAILGHIRPALLGKDLDSFEEVQAALHGAIVGNTSAKAAVDMALYDLFAQSCNQPLYRLLGGARSELETDLTISLNEPQQMVQDSLAAVQAGYRILKVKVGKGGDDVQRIRAVRQAVGVKVRLRVDANQGWQAKQAVRLIRQMEDAGLDIDLVEQPVPAHDLQGLAEVTRQVDTPILADESVFSAQNALKVLQCHAADYINIKLMKTGGIAKALQICTLAELYGVQCMVGCMLESRLSVSAAAHLAAARQVVTMVDLDGPGLCAADPFTGGPVFDGPRILLGTAPGIGVEPTTGYLEEEAE